jgi:hypothetical protein
VVTSCAQPNLVSGWRALAFDASNLQSSGHLLTSGGSCTSCWRLYCSESAAMGEEVEKHVLRKYELLQKLGKGVRYLVVGALVAEYAGC